MQFDWLFNLFIIKLIIAISINFKWKFFKVKWEKMYVHKLRNKWMEARWNLIIISA